MRPRGIVSVMVVALAWTATASASVEIDTLSLWDGEKQVSGFGEPYAPYIGQSFVALDERITSLSFLLDGQDDVESNEPDTTDFHVLIAPLASSGDRPEFDGILFESTTYSTSLETDFELFTINLDVVVQPGESYMWVLDSFVTFDGLPGTAAVALTYDAFPYGDFRSFTIPQPPDVGTRSDHDDYIWGILEPPSVGDIPTVDIAFSMTFVPEPASGLVCLLLMAILRSRRGRGAET